jgi:ribosomal protein S18
VGCGPDSDVAKDAAFSSESGEAELGDYLLVCDGRMLGEDGQLAQEVDSADQGKVNGFITEQFRIERERIDLTEAEQRELGRFLTASQRARYMGIQEQIRRELDQLRGRGRAGMGPPDSGQRRRPPG